MKLNCLKNKLWRNGISGMQHANNAESLRDFSIKFSCLTITIYAWKRNMELLQLQRCRVNIYTHETAIDLTLIYSNLNWYCHQAEIQCNAAKMVIASLHEWLSHEVWKYMQSEIWHKPNFMPSPNFNKNEAKVLNFSFVSSLKTNKHMELNHVSVQNFGIKW